MTQLLSRASGLPSASVGSARAKAPQPYPYTAASSLWDGSELRLGKGGVFEEGLPKPHLPAWNQL